MFESCVWLRMLEMMLEFRVVLSVKFSLSGGGGECEKVLVHLARRSWHGVISGHVQITVPPVTAFCCMCDISPPHHHRVGSPM